jgi:hypothetical protein
MDTAVPQKNTMRKNLLVLALIAMVALIVTLEVRRQQAQAQLEQLTIRLEQLQTGNTRQNREAAERIVERVRKLYAIPADVEPTVATIVDVEALRSRNPFYNKAENGDHLVVTTDRAILFDPDKNMILDVVPVQLQQAQPQQAAPAAEGGGQPVAQ